MIRPALGWAAVALVAALACAQGPGYKAILPGEIAQPDAAQIEAISLEFAGPPGSEGQVVWVRDRVIYFRYTGRDGPFAFHPLAAATYLMAHSQDADVLEAARGLCELGAALPNGGKAYFYPKRYRVARLLGPDFRYSAISQAKIMSVLAKLSVDHEGFGREEAERAYRALAYPYEKGGVLLDGKALLEVPLYRSVPEIILNGWQSALLDLHDYARLFADKEAQDLFQASVAFLGTLLPGFDCAEHRLSRYSDACPYRLTIVAAALRRGQPPPGMSVRHASKVPGISSYTFPVLPVEHGGHGRSIYDSQVSGVRDGELEAWVVLSRHFKPTLRIEVAEASLRIDPGEFSPEAIAPVPAGRPVLVQGSSRDGGTEFDLDALSDRLILGYPTNFKKSRPEGLENFYHVYHYVGLLALAAGVDDAKTRGTLISWALRWRAYASLPDHPWAKDGRKFGDPERVKQSIDRNRSLPTPGTFEDLLQWAQSTQGSVPYASWMEVAKRGQPDVRPAEAPPQ